MKLAKRFCCYGIVLVLRSHLVDSYIFYTLYRSFHGFIMYNTFWIDDSEEKKCINFNLIINFQVHFLVDHYYDLFFICRQLWFGVIMDVIIIDELIPKKCIVVSDLYTYHYIIIFVQCLGLNLAI